LKLTFLGTGTSQGVPVIACDCRICRSLDFRDKRLRSSVHIQHNDLSIVVDTGPDFRQQMLRENIQHLDAVLFTHEHKDHTAGMDDIRSYNFKQNMDMPIYAREKVINQLRQEFSYVFQKSPYPGIPQVEVHEIVNEPFEVKGLHVMPIEVMHMKLPVFGFRFGDITYITDAKTISEPERKKIRGSKVLVLNALHQKNHYSHLNLKEAIELAEDLDVGQTYFTHISHWMGLHGEVQKELPDNMFLAYDGLQVEVD
jgi:phosphoribosyl 1,2-cyclic phosphate phosphodiesterase